MVAKKYSKICESGKHRLVLAREWNASAPGIVLIGLNPSTANGSQEDSTTTKLNSILDYNGYGSYCLLNLWTYMSTDPRALRKMDEDEKNHENASEITKRIFAIGEDTCWMFGSNVSLDNYRVREMIRMAPVTVDHYCFGTNKNGTPKHPLYLKNKTKLELWQGINSIQNSAN